MIGVNVSGDHVGLSVRQRPLPPTVKVSQDEIEGVVDAVSTVFSVMWDRLTG